MTTREKILLGICVVAALGGMLSYALGFVGSNQENTAKAKDYTALIAEVQEKLKSAKLTSREKAVLQAATIELTQNPLRSGPVEGKVKNQNQNLKRPEYTGFLRVGGHSIAIIGGVDYRAGDLIEGGEFQLISIFPNRIEILLNGAKEPTSVPLLEEKPQ
ncbi:MAG: hypothetical protein ABF379_16370 [Akkermansiaceae bacterium]